MKDLHQDSQLWLEDALLLKDIWILLSLTALITMPMQAWKTPHWLVMVGTVVLAAMPGKSWRLPHWLTMLGALLLAGVSTWLKYGGPDFQVNDTPMLALVLLVLRAMYQTPPSRPQG